FSRPPDSATLAPLRFMVGHQAPFTKEGLYHSATFVLKNCSLNHNPMVQNFAAAQTKVTLDCASLRIARAVDQPLNARMNDRPRTHRARLDRRKQRAPGEPVVSKHTPGFSQCHHLGMSRGIAAL